MRVTTQAERGFLISLRAAVLALATPALAAFSLALAGQTLPALQITSPLDGTVVTPGQTISVSVTSLVNISFKQVFVIAEQPLPTSTIASSAPAQFSLLIPQDARPGKYLLTAWGTTTGNQTQGSAPVTIDVERADLPTKLTASKSRIGFQSQGQKVALRIYGTFADGSVLDLSVSSNLAYTSSNARVATVDTNGVVTATAAGNASITATYGQGARSVSLSVAVTVPLPVLAPSPQLQQPKRGR